jgi:hypothetical protein
MKEVGIQKSFFSGWQYERVMPEELQKKKWATMLNPEVSNGHF